MMKSTGVPGRGRSFMPHRVSEVFRPPSDLMLPVGEEDREGGQTRWLLLLGYLLLLVTILFVYVDQPAVNGPWYGPSLLLLVGPATAAWIAPFLTIRPQRTALYYGLNLLVFTFGCFAIMVSSHFYAPHLFVLYVLVILAAVYYGGIGWGLPFGLLIAILGAATVLLTSPSFTLAQDMFYTMMLWCVGGLYALITLAQARTQQRLIHQVAQERKLHAQLASISNMARAISGNFSLDNLFAEVVRSATSLLAVDFCALHTCDHEAGLLRMRTLYAPDPDLQRKLGDEFDSLVLRLDQGLSGWVVQHKRPLATERAGDHPAFVSSPDMLESGGYGMLHVPLNLKGVVIGVIGLVSLTPRIFSEEDVSLLSSFASQVTVAIENAKLLSETKEQQGRLERSSQGLTAVLNINRAILGQRDYMATLRSIVENLMALVPFTNCVVYNLVENGTMLEAVLAEGVDIDLLSNERFSVDEGIVGLVARSGHSELVNHAERDERATVANGVLVGEPWSLLVIPFVTKEQQVSGVIRLGRAGDWEFEHDEFELLDIFAAQASLALESAQLFGEVESKKQVLEQQLREQDMLFQVSNLTVTAGVGNSREEHDYSWLRACIGLLKHELEIEAAVILFNQDRHEVIALTNGFSRQGQDLIRRYVAEGEPYRARQDGEPLNPNTCVDFGGLEEALSHSDGIHQLLPAPLLARKQMIGVLVVFSRNRAGLVQPPASSDSLILWPSLPSSALYNLLPGHLSEPRVDPIGNIDQEVRTMLRSMANVIASGIENIRSYQSLRDTYFQTIRMLVEIMENKDPYTKGHSDRVARYAKKIGTVFVERGLITADELDKLERAALLHDIGKLGIKDELLHLSGKLGVEGFWILASHTQRGANILSKIEMLKPLAPLVKAHHERFDGLGYPDGLMREEIPLISRIVAVADSYDAMTTDRDYQKARPAEWALGELERNKATQFDPLVVDVFVALQRADLAVQSRQAVAVVLPHQSLAIK